jgi:integrase
LESLSDTLAAHKTKLKNPCHVTLIRLLLLTGARVSEIQNAKWEWIDFDKKLLILPDSKTGKRVIFLTKPVLAILKQMPRIAEHPYILFGRQFGKSIGVPNASWNLIRAKAGLVDFRIHDLRHSYATICNQLELSEGTIGTLLGHRSKTTVTQRYIHHVDGFVREAAEKVADYIGKVLKVEAKGETLYVYQQREAACA